MELGGCNPSMLWRTLSPFQICKNFSFSSNVVRVIAFSVSQTRWIWPAHTWKSGFSAVSSYFQPQNPLWPAPTCFPKCTTPRGRPGSWNCGDTSPTSWVIGRRLSPRSAENGDSGGFTSFWNPQTHFGCPKLGFSNSSHRGDRYEVGMVKIHRLQVEIWSEDGSRRVQKRMIFAVVRHFGPPRPILGNQKQL